MELTNTERQIMLHELAATNNPELGNVPITGNVRDGDTQSALAKMNGYNNAEVEAGKRVNSDFINQYDDPAKGDKYLTQSFVDAYNKQHNTHINAADDNAVKGAMNNVKREHDDLQGLAAAANHILVLDKEHGRIYEDQSQQIPKMTDGDLKQLVQSGQLATNEKIDIYNHNAEILNAPKLDNLRTDGVADEKTRELFTAASSGAFDGPDAGTKLAAILKHEAPHIDPAHADPKHRKATPKDSDNALNGTAPHPASKDHPHVDVSHKDIPAVSTDKDSRVLELQAAIGAKDDGKLGHNTEAKLRETHPEMNFAALGDIKSGTHADKAALDKFFSDNAEKIAKLENHPAQESNGTVVAKNSGNPTVDELARTAKVETRDPGMSAPSTKAPGSDIETVISDFTKKVDALSKGGSLDMEAFKKEAAIVSEVAHNQTPSIAEVKEAMKGLMKGGEEALGHQSPKPVPGKGVPQGQIGIV